MRECVEECIGLCTGVFNYFLAIVTYTLLKILLTMLE
jgi:hypothetical protein